MTLATGLGKGTDCPSPKELVNKILEAHPQLSQLSSFTPTVYDSAWLSMLYKPIEESSRATVVQLFPECFEYILTEQENGGGWGCYGSCFDALLNSLAGLLALIVYRKTCGTTFDKIDIAVRIADATASLEKALMEWDINATVQVGFEILVTGLLSQLQSLEINFEFDNRPCLQRLYQKKMQKFVPEMIYSKKQTTILHSLEALVGVIDFDRVAHHCSQETGILASPSATAVYLIHATRWDDGAERYLRTVVGAAGQESKGGIPSAFPTCIFEITWMLSSMLSSGFDADDFDPESLSRISTFLQETMKLKNGTIGFAPGLLPDADDTARTLMTLQLLGKRPDFAPMNQAFETNDHFRTYDFERNPSFSANCNVLIALTCINDADQYAMQINKTLKFVLEKFEQHDVSDKWNISPQYSAMLMAQALVQCLDIYERGALQQLDKAIFDERIPVAVCRLLHQTISAQRAGGDWNNSMEETSYSILTLTQCQRVSWNQVTTSAVRASLERGRDYLRLHYRQGEKAHFLWVEKTTYEPSLLKLAYCSMALHNADKTLPQCTTDKFVVPEMQVKKMTHLLSALPNFTSKDLATVDIVLAEASQLSTFLRRRRQELVVRDQIKMTKDKYLDFIPVIWTMCNAKANHVLPIEVVREMVHISLLNYQIDEYMETIVGELDGASINEIVNELRKELNRTDQNGNTDSNGFEHTACENGTQGDSKRRKICNGDIAETNGNGHALSSTVIQVLTVLRRCISHVLQNATVLASPPQVQRTLSKEILTFVLAHIAHNADNRVLQQGSAKGSSSSFTCSDIERNSYYKWVNSTGANDTSCPFSFQLFACLTSHSLAVKAGQHKAAHDPYCFASAHAKYVAETVARRLAAMCRMYNDYGSAARDAEEVNLNSLDFNEFGSTDGASRSSVLSNGTQGTYTNGHDRCNDNKYNDSEEQARKGQLMAIAEFEREGMEHAMATLEKLVPDRIVMDMLRVFVDVTDTFGLLYVQKDIASTRTQNGKR